MASARVDRLANTPICKDRGIIFLTAHFTTEILVSPHIVFLASLSVQADGILNTCRNSVSRSSVQRSSPL